MALLYSNQATFQSIQAFSTEGAAFDWLARPR